MTTTATTATTTAVQPTIGQAGAYRRYVSDSERQRIPVQLREFYTLVKIGAPMEDEMDCCDSLERLMGFAKGHPNYKLGESRKLYAVRTVRAAGGTSTLKGWIRVLAGHTDSITDKSF